MKGIAMNFTSSINSKQLVDGIDAINTEILDTVLISSHVVKKLQPLSDVFLEVLAGSTMGLAAGTSHLTPSTVLVALNSISRTVVGETLNSSTVMNSALVLKSIGTKMSSGFQYILLAIQKQYGSNNGPISKTDLFREATSVPCKQLNLPHQSFQRGFN